MQDPVGNDGLALENVLSFEEFTSQGSIGPKHNNFFMFFFETEGNMRRDPEIGAYLTEQTIEQYVQNSPTARAIVRFKKEQYTLDRKIVSSLTPGLKRIQTKRTVLDYIMHEQSYPKNIRQAAFLVNLDMGDEHENIIHAHAKELYKAYKIMRSYGFSDRDLIT